MICRLSEMEGGGPSDANTSKRTCLFEDSAVAVDLAGLYLIVAYIYEKWSIGPADLGVKRSGFERIRSHGRLYSDLQRYSVQ